MKPLLKNLMALGLVIVVSAGSYFMLLRYFSQQEAGQTARTAAFFARTIDGALARLKHLPYVISQNPSVAEALAQNDRQALNPVLKRFAERANADHIFLMDINGKTIAASNFESANSFVGKRYTFRPYFKAAISGEAGQFYAIGATTGQPGYFVSAPVFDAAGNVVGVVVVKIGLGGLNQAWQDSGEEILVSDENAVIVLASDPANLFRVLRPLTAFARQSVATAQQFADQPLLPLDWQVGSNGQVRLNGTAYLLSQARIEPQNWTLHLLTNLAGIRQQAALSVAAGLMVLFGGIIASVSFRSARLKKALGQSDADRARLTQEIEVRRAAESDLKLAKDELERASRLAALGQLSASITHELGQPIAAMRTYLAAEEIAADSPPDSLNPVLSGLVDRMQNICTQLRVFATPKRRETRLFDLRRACDASVDLIAHGLEEISLTKTYAPCPVLVVGNQQRVEQVLINLLRNAVDAVLAHDQREIELAVSTDDGWACVRVTDTGAGLGGRVISDLQEPFMTTKPTGEGMGLGLAISAQIAKDMQGRLEAQDAKTGGAEFTLRLPLSKDTP